MPHLDPVLIDDLARIEREVHAERQRTGTFLVATGFTAALVGLVASVSQDFLPAMTTLLATGMVAGTAVSSGVRALEQVQRSRRTSRSKG